MILYSAGSWNVWLPINQTDATLCLQIWTPALHIPAPMGLETQPAKTYLLLHWITLQAVHVCAALASLTVVMAVAAQVRM
jgi:hypothetical protein